MNPFKISGPAVISFSGGRTSGYMLHRILEAHNGTLPDDVRVVFCNTGKERPETLSFVERCAQRWSVPITWLEYRYETPIPCPTRDPDWPLLNDEVGGMRDQRWDVWHKLIAPMRLKHGADVELEQEARNKLPRKLRRGLARLSRGLGRHDFAIVNYATASKCGEPFEEVIAARNMLPNIMSRFCTVECKIRTTARHLRNLGWIGWTNCIGFRKDEPARVAKLSGTNRHSCEEPIAPLYKAGITLADVTAFWAQNDFDLELQSHEGNCDLCFLKGIGKMKTIMRVDPNLANWWMRMETAADRRGLARNPTVARFRKDRPKVSVLLELSARPGLFDADETDELSIACHCTD